MNLTFAKPHKSITGPVTTQTLNDFVVLSGENGAGKTHLLEAIESECLHIDDVSGANAQIRHFSAGARGLTPLPDFYQGPPNILKHDPAILARRIDELRIGLTPRGDLTDDAAMEAELKRLVLGDPSLLTEAQLTDLTRQADKTLLQLTDDDFARHAPILAGPRNEPFQLSFTDLFLAYHTRLITNQFNQWRAEKGYYDGTPLTDEEFSTQFGPPPWTLLDETLSALNLDYSFVPPKNMSNDPQYQASLQHSDGARVSPEELSTGEKSLLATVTAFYAGSELEGTVQMPRVVLLDEADAPLHPSMIHVLLRVLRETFVDQYGVKVILTTHSPTTVALAPEESLYIMRRDSAPRLIKAADRDHALSSLTIGLSTLSVRVDGQRTVFVEGKDDAPIYQEFLRVNRQRFDSELSLDFVASGHGGQGNSQTVKHLVQTLHASQNRSVWGIVDRDSRGGAGDGVVFASERYAIENFVFDPLILGTFLLRQGYLKSDELGFEAGFTHMQLAPGHAQLVVDKMSGLVQMRDADTTLRRASYAGNFTVDVPDYWLNTPGHDLEGRITEVFKPLRSHQKGLKLAIVKLAVADHPDFTPTAMLDLFRSIFAG